MARQKRSRRRDIVQLHNRKGKVWRRKTRHDGRKIGPRLSGKTNYDAFPRFCNSPPTMPITLLWSGT